MSINHNQPPVRPEDRAGNGKEFWNSERAKSIVREHLVPEWSVALGDPIEWSPAAGEEVWLALSREVRDRAHRWYPRPGFHVLTSALEEAKQAASVYGQLRTRLTAFAHLLSAWRLKFHANHGGHCWGSVQPTIDDPKEKVVVELLRQISARSICDAVNDLDRIGREGLTYQLAGQDPIRMTPADCGIKHFVEAARRLDLRLVGQVKPVPQAQEGTANDDPNKWPRVMVYIEQGQIKLTRTIPKSSTSAEVYRECFLTRPKFVRLFWALLMCKGRVSRETLYTKFTHKEEHDYGEPYGKSTENRLTQLRSELEQYLVDHLGSHPVSGERWISTSDKNGYCLTRGVRFQPHDKDLNPDM